MSVGATGNEITYQWHKDRAPITNNPSASTPTLTIVNAQVSDSGTYTAVVSNAGGSVLRPRRMHARIGVDAQIDGVHQRVVGGIEDADPAARARASLQHDKAIGGSDSATADRNKLRVTIHHNVFDRNVQRAPRVTRRTTSRRRERCIRRGSSAASTAI